MLAYFQFALVINHGVGRYAANKPGISPYNGIMANHGIAAKDCSIGVYDNMSSIVGCRFFEASDFDTWVAPNVTP